MPILTGKIAQTPGGVTWLSSSKWSGKSYFLSANVIFFQSYFYLIFFISDFLLQRKKYIMSTKGIRCRGSIAIKDPLRLLGIIMFAYISAIR